jgi:hypothetical protein
MGESTKFLRVFFSRFSGDAEGDAHNGLIEPRSSQEGFVYFCCLFSGSKDLLIKENGVKGEIRVSLSTGVKIRAKCRIPFSTDEKFLQDWVPGIQDQTLRESMKIGIC